MLFCVGVDSLLAGHAMPVVTTFLALEIPLSAFFFRHDIRVLAIAVERNGSRVRTPTTFRSALEGRRSLVHPAGGRRRRPRLHANGATLVRPAASRCLPVQIFENARAQHLFCR